MANVLNTDKQIAIIAALAEGSSIRSIERMTGIHRDTIMRLGVRVGEGCTALLDAKMRDLPCNRLEIDEVWGFIGKKESRLKPDDDPQFGNVWTSGKTVLPCSPRRDPNARRCPHGRDISCPHRHPETIPASAAPLCRDCYDYIAAVLFNAYAAELWRRFTTYLPRYLARLAGLTVTELRDRCRIRYVKVAEYQHRGVVHFHAVIRLDAPGELAAAPRRAHRRLLGDAIRDAARPSPSPPPRPRTAAGHPTFGTRQDRRPARPPRRRPPRHRTRPVRTVSGELHRQVRHQDPRRPRLPARPSSSRPDRPAALLRPLQADDARCLEPPASKLPAIPACAGPLMLGWGGHFLTKSRRYSVTFGTLRRARLEHRKAQRHPDGERDPWGRPLDDTIVLILKTWSYAAPGTTTSPDPTSPSPAPPVPAITTRPPPPPDPSSPSLRSDAP